MPFSVAAAGLNTLGSIINTKQINENNLKIARETNAANREMVEMQNKAAAAESEKAYQRSKSSTQVTNMMQAGMPRAGAINALNGGGSYTPAPVNVSQDTAPQMQTTDLSGLANMGQALSNIDLDKVKYTTNDRKELSGIFDVINKNTDELGGSPTLKELYALLNDKQKKALTNPYVREQVNDFINQSSLQSDSRWNQSFNIAALREAEAQADLVVLERDIQQALKDGRIDAEKEQYLSNKVQASLEKFRSEKVKEQMGKMSDEDLQRLFELQATLNMIQQGLQYDGTQFVVQGVKKLGNLLAKGKGAGKNIRSH